MCVHACVNVLVCMCVCVCVCVCVYVYAVFIRILTIFVRGIIAFSARSIMNEF